MISNILSAAVAVSLLAAQTDTLTLDGSVVSTPKAGARLQDIPAEISVATSFDVKKLPSPTVADVLRKAPGISKGGDGIWATSLRIRGLGENRLVTLADGCRVEVASDLTTSLSMFDVPDIERIEVIKGAQSSIYGSGAIGGIINVISRDGHFSAGPYFGGNFTSGFSSANKGHGEYLSLCGGGERWYLLVKGSFAGAGDIRTTEGFLPNSGYNSTAFGATAAFKPLDNHVLKLRLDRNMSRDVGIPGGAAFSPSATASYRKADRTLASLNYEIGSIGDNLRSLAFKAYIQDIALDVTMNPNMPAPADGAVPTLVTPYAQHRTVGAGAESRWKAGAFSGITAGAEIWRRAISSERAKYIDQYSGGVLAAQMIRREIPLPEASYTSAGIYAQDETVLLDGRLILTLGGRADVNFVQNGECHNVETVENVTAGTVIGNPPGKYTTFTAGTRTDPSWSANAGILFKATDGLDLTANVSRSYRSPALEELFKFIDLAGGKIHFGNPELGAEKGIGGDVGLRLRTGKLELRLDGFANSIRDMIVERRTNVCPESVNDTLVLGNTGRALLFGGEFSASYELAAGVKAYASGSVIVGKETAGRSLWLPGIPPASLVAGIEYENSRLLGADLSVVAASARPEGKVADGERPTGGWIRLDFSIHSKIFGFGRCNLQLFGGVDNLTDASYTNFLSTNRGNIICEPGRNVYLRANFTF